MRNNVGTMIMRVHHPQVPPVIMRSDGPKGPTDSAIAANRARKPKTTERARNAQTQDAESLDSISSTEH